MVSFMPLATSLDHVCVTTMVGIAPSSMRTEDQAGSGSQILAFHKASTWWSRTIGPEAQVCVMWILASP